jgi:hypothetical protein
MNSRRLIAVLEDTLKGHAAYQPTPVLWKGAELGTMSALGHKQTNAAQNAMSALPPIATAKADSPNGDVRFGSKADICGAINHVRFTPDSDRESRHPHKVMSALPPIADMCSALAHVSFGPKADISQLRARRRFDAPYLGAGAIYPASERG